MQASNRRAVLAALCANLGIASAKFVGYAITGASSMLAESVHSVGDTSNQALLLWGGVAAARDPTRRHPFGYGRERYVWSFVVALVIFSRGAVFALREGVSRLLEPHSVEHAYVAIIILVVGVGLEGASFRIALREGRKEKAGESWWQYIRGSRSPELPVVLLEDFGALCGLVLALAGVGLTLITGNPQFDALASVAIGVLLAGIAAVLAIEMKSLIIGEAATREDLERIESLILENAQVKRVIHIRTQHVGPDQLLVAAKLEFVPPLSLAELSAAIDLIEARLRAALPIARMIYIEPGIFEPQSERP